MLTNFLNIKIENFLSINFSKKLESICLKCPYGLRLRLYYSTFGQLSCNPSETGELRPIRNENARFWMVATHRFLSGCGLADSKLSIIVVSCDCLSLQPTTPPMRNKKNPQLFHSSFWMPVSCDQLETTKCYIFYFFLGKETFSLLYYEFDASTKEPPFWDSESYKLIDRIAADEGRFTNSNEVIINTEVRSIPVTKKGVYFAFKDQGACISLLAIKVIYSILLSHLISIWGYWTKVTPGIFKLLPCLSLLYLRLDKVRVS